jgi:hypothetical protein
LCKYYFWQSSGIQIFPDTEKIQLGKWRISCILSLEGDQLLEYEGYLYSAELGDILYLNLDLLRRLTFSAATFASEHSPALVYLQTGQAISGSKVEVHQIQNGLVTFTGALSLDDRARIYNWFSRFAPGAARAKSKWLQ